MRNSRRLGCLAALVVFGSVLVLTFRFLTHSGEGTVRSQGAIYCDAPYFDLGRMYRPAPKILQPRFKLKNTSHRTVTLRVAATTCACTTAKLVKTTLEPSEETELCVEWELPNETKLSKFDVFVESDPPGWAHLSGTVSICDVIVLNKDEVSLGDLIPGETLTDRIEIRPWPGEILSDKMCISDTSMYPEFEVVEQKRTNDILILAVSVTGRPGLDQKTYNLTITTENSIQPTVEIPVIAHHLEQYEAQPSVVLLTGGENMNGAKLVKIVSNGGLPVIIERIDVDDETIISASPMVGESNANTIRIQPKKEKSNIQAVGSIDVFVVGHTRPITIRYVCM